MYLHLLYDVANNLLAGEHVEDSVTRQHHEVILCSYLEREEKETRRTEPTKEKQEQSKATIKSNKGMDENIICKLVSTCSSGSWPKKLNSKRE